jgi:hypothetical protein
VGLLETLLRGRETDEDMAHAKAKPLDDVRIDEHVQHLRRTIKDGPAFKLVYESLVNDQRLSAQDVIAIAYKFVGGKRPPTRKAALTTIGQERMRVSHAKSKAASAAKSTTW